jgi:hypothetical protein
MLATMGIQNPLHRRYVSATVLASQESSATVADCSASQNEGIASIDAGCSAVAGGMGRSHSPYICGMVSLQFQWGSFAPPVDPTRELHCRERCLSYSELIILRYPVALFVIVDDGARLG